MTDDAPELTDAELAGMRPARDVLTPEDFAAVSSVRGQTGSKVSAATTSQRSDGPVGTGPLPSPGRSDKRRA